MAEIVNASNQNAPGLGNPNNAQAEQTTAQSQSDNVDVESRGYSRGLSAGRKEILSKLGFDTAEELKLKLDAAKQIELDASAKLMAESQDKETLARKLQAAETELSDLRGKASQLNNLRDTMLKDNIKNAGLSAGIRNDALDLLIVACDGKVSWNEDFSKVKVTGNEGKELDSLDTLMTEIKTTKPFLFAPTGRQGSGVIPRVVGDPVSGDNSNVAPKFVPLSERIKRK